MRIKYLPDPMTFLLDSGLLFEINRRILHPYGLSMTKCPSKKPLDPALCAALRIWDNREEEAGLSMPTEAFQKGAAKSSIMAETFRCVGRFEARRKNFGYVIQGCSSDKMAQVAYTAYGDSVEWLDPAGRQLPLWLDLPEKIQHAWRTAVEAVTEP